MDNIENVKMPMENIKPIIESLLFASDEPLSVTRFHDIISEATPQSIRNVLNELKSEYEASNRAFTIEEIADGYQLLTKPQYKNWVEKLQKVKAEEKLSPAAIETLAIIAYKQPIKRADLEAIRGVQSGQLIRALMERGLVRIVGRENIPGAPILYGTTKKFLELFNLCSLEDLPKPEEVK